MKQPEEWAERIQWIILGWIKMEERIKELKEDTKIESILNRLENLSDEEIETIFNWLEDSKILPYYLKHIETFTYEEFVEFLYNGIYEEEIMLSLIESNIYKKYL